MKHHFRAAMAFGLVLLPSDSKTMREGVGWRRDTGATKDSRLVAAR
jgi:hypothetical protein